MSADFLKYAVLDSFATMKVAIVQWGSKNESTPGSEGARRGTVDLPKTPVKAAGKPAPEGT